MFGTLGYGKSLGGSVKKNPIKEIGWRDSSCEPFKISLTEEGKNGPIFEGIKSEFEIF